MRSEKSPGRILHWFKSTRPQTPIIYGGFLVLVAFFYTVLVVEAIGENIVFLAPAGIVANFVFPAWLFVTAIHLILREGALRELLAETVHIITRINLTSGRLFSR
ncbi:hypothetical protein [Haladaptatus salinisoli]|uniref:hypothetical protein n=1 Tax=Haladaptatus salinisoli TaxID=2884876 RepID=UPI001D0AD0E3|nr:hypothetical protein [Haladaptatus salinisoli]